MSEDLQNLGPPVQTAGALLRQARESTGLHIAALAVAMKVPVKKLEALEADRLDTLHDAVFVRALAASMCRTLKIDPLPVLGLLPKTVALQFERDDRGINMPYSSGLLAGNGLRGLFAKPAVLLVAALVIGRDMGSAIGGHRARRGAAGSAQGNDSCQSRQRGCSDCST